MLLRNVGIVGIGLLSLGCSTKEPAKLDARALYSVLQSEEYPVTLQDAYRDGRAGLLVRVCNAKRPVYDEGFVREDQIEAMAESLESPRRAAAIYQMAYCGGMQAALREAMNDNGQSTPADRAPPAYFSDSAVHWKSGWGAGYRYAKRFLVDRALCGRVPRPGPLSQGPQR